MKASYQVLALAFTLITSPLIGASQAFANPACSLIIGAARTAEDPLLFADLIQLQRQQTLNLKPEEVLAMNRSAIEKAEAQGSAHAAPTLHDLKQLQSRMRETEVIRAQHDGQYDQCDTAIGYCFGRATFVDVALRKLGYSTENIRKVWAVGNIGDEGPKGWAFHVATVVRATDGRWYVIDDLFKSVLTLEEWSAVWEGQATRKDVRIFITDPNKLSVSLGPYDRVQMGLDLDRKKDWYRGFFQDLLAWFDKEGGLASLGLKPHVEPQAQVVARPTLQTSATTVAESPVTNPTTTAAGATTAVTSGSTSGSTSGATSGATAAPHAATVEAESTSHIQATVTTTHESRTAEAQTASTRDSSTIDSAKGASSKPNPVLQIFNQAYDAYFAHYHYQQNFSPTNPIYAAEGAKSVAAGERAYTTYLQLAKTRSFADLYADLGSQVSRRDQYGPDRAPYRFLVRLISISYHETLRAFADEAKQAAFSEADANFKHFDAQANAYSAQNIWNGLLSKLRDIAADRAVSAFREAAPQMDFAAAEKAFWSYQGIASDFRPFTQRHQYAVKIRAQAQEIAVQRLRDSARSMSTSEREKMRSYYAAKMAQYSPSAVGYAFYRALAEATR